MSQTNVLQFPAPLTNVALIRFGDAASLHAKDVEAAFERGRCEGERCLSEQLIRQRAEVLEVQTGILTSLRKLFPQVASECERALVALALEVARKVVAGTPISAEMIEASIRDAREEMETSAEHCVLLHPEDLALLQRVNSPLLLPQSGQEKIHFRSSPQVTRGGCMIETKFGIIDARRETVLAQFEKALQP